MKLYYVDTSALVKLISEETHSAAFRDFYLKNIDATWMSSSLLRVEVCRTVTRGLPHRLPDARRLLRSVGYIRLGEHVLDAAIDEPDPYLRSLDAIHLASARSIGQSLTGLITYDTRLQTAAMDAGLTAIAPT